MSLLCIKSVHEHVPGAPITIILDDFDLDLWPDFTTTYQNYVKSQFPESKIDFRFFSQLDKIDDAKMGGWFRQQLVKLHVDHFVEEDNILLIDADVILEECPRLDTVPAGNWPSTPINAGFNLYVEYMLNHEPWLGTKDQNLSTSWVPVRYVSRQLIQALRQHVESTHGKNFLDLHLDLMRKQQIVAYDPACQTMIMSEFELIEVFRRHLWHKPLPFSAGAGRFYHTSKKDWQVEKHWFESKALKIPNALWNKVNEFGSNPIYHTDNQ